MGWGGKLQRYNCKSYYSTVYWNKEKTIKFNTTPNYYYFYFNYFHGGEKNTKLVFYSEKVKLYYCQLHSK